MVFYWSLSDSKSPHVSMTLIILADLDNAVVWMVFTRSLISKSSSPCTNPLVTVLRASIKIGITVTFMFHSFFSPLARSRYLSLFSLSFSFTLWSAGTAKSAIRHVLFHFFLLSLGLIVWPRIGDLFVSQNPREFYVSFTRTDTVLCICHLVVWPNLNFLHNSQWITFLSQLCLV